MDAQVLYHDVRVRQDGVEGKGLGEAAYSCWGPISFVANNMTRGLGGARTDDDELSVGKRLIFGVYRHRWNVEPASERW